jgi:uncharacterized membrane protein YccC
VANTDKALTSGPGQPPPGSRANRPERRQTENGTNRRAAIVSFFRDESLIWVHVFKVVFAGLLTLGIAMLFELDSPRTALTTVFIVMTPQAGPVLAKSFYRMVGTVVGSAMMLVLIGVFGQQPTLFMSGLSLWIGICAAGASRCRDFKAYGFVLAGYTAALTGIPALLNPLGAFDLVVTRVLEVTLAIVVSAVVTTVIFPQRSSAAFHRRREALVQGFLDFMAEVFCDPPARSRVDAENARLLSETMGLSSLRTIAAFEDADLRDSEPGLVRLNHEFMAVSTQLHAFHQVRNRQRLAGMDLALSLLEPHLRELGRLLARTSDDTSDLARTTRVSLDLKSYLDSLPARLDADRHAHRSDLSGEQLDTFETGAELLSRLAAQVHALLIARQNFRSFRADNSQSRMPHNETPLLITLLAGFRPTLLVAVVSAFWIGTAWTDGAFVVLGAAAVASLCSTAPRPAVLASQLAVGTFISAICGLLVVYFLYPIIDGFAMMCVVLAPFLIFGARISLSPRWPGIGVGFCIFFCFSAGPDNPQTYEIVDFLNTNLSLIVSMIATAATYAVIVPASSPLLHRYLVWRLRMQIDVAAFGSLPRLGARFESGTRDMVNQISAWSTQGPSHKRRTLRWMLLVLEAGRALIELRDHMAKLKGKPGCHAWSVQIEHLQQALSAGFRRPEMQTLQATLGAVNRAIDEARALIASNATDPALCHGIKQGMTDLHFIRAALRDRTSPLQSLARARQIKQSSR